jgi:DNA-binding PadR family transcriptional regulator
MPRKSADTHWTDPGILIMGSLAAEARHGYAIVKDVAASTGIELGPGTLYGAIARLEQRGLVEALEGDDRRRPYRLTPRGAEVLETEIGRMGRFAKTTKRRLSAQASPR